MADETPTQKVETPDSPATPTATPDPPVNPPKTEKAEHDALGFAQRKQQEAEKTRDEAIARAKELEAKVKAAEDAKLSEEDRLRKDHEEAKKEAERLRLDNARLKAIAEADLPPELRDAVPEGIEDPATWIKEKLIPIKEKMVTTTAFGNPTNPPTPPLLDEGKRLLDTYNALVAKHGGSPKDLGGGRVDTYGMGHNHPEVQAFYNENAALIQQAMAQQK